jgi:hypothetical protein
MDNYNEWATKVVTQKLRSDRVELQKEAAQEDLTRPVLENLLHQGYEIVKWDSGNSRCATCLELNNQQWNLTDFLSNLRHDAPIAEKSHPNDANCKVIVSGPNVPTVAIDYNGNLEYV